MLNKDELVLIACKLNISALLKFFRVCKVYYEKVCKNNDFWKRKLAKERPGLINILTSSNYKEIYTNLIKFQKYLSVKYTANPLKFEGVVAGFIGTRRHGGSILLNLSGQSLSYLPRFERIYPLYSYFTCLFKSGIKVWGCISSNSEEFTPNMSPIKEDLLYRLISHFKDRTVIHNYFDSLNIPLEQGLNEYRQILSEKGYIELFGISYLLQEMTLL